MSGRPVSYEYRALDPGKHEIRLLTIHPSSKLSTQVSCTLATTSLDNGPEYEALSYCWGDQSNPISIKLEGVYFPVTSNLYLALRRLRQKTEPRTFWIDAICINQADLPERSSQVRMMLYIFLMAKETTVWLGDAADHSGLAFGLIRSMASMAELSVDQQDHLINNQPAMLKEQSWKALEELFHRDWWFRMWVYQEFVVSRKVTFLCGMHSASNYTVLRAIYLWKSDLIKYVKHRAIMQVLVRNTYSPLMKARRLYWSPEQHLPNRVTTTEDFLRDTAALKATDPRDKIYALLGVANSINFPLIPDYEKPVAEVFLDFATKYISATSKLSILALAGMFFRASEETQCLPSWVPDLSCVGDGRIQSGSAAAGGDIAPAFEFDYNILKSSGLICDNLVDLVPNQRGKLSEGLISKWKRVVEVGRELPYHTEEPLVQAFFRTAIMDHSDYNIHTSQEDRRDFFELATGFMVVIGTYIWKSWGTDPTNSFNKAEWQEATSQNSDYVTCFAYAMGAPDRPPEKDVPDEIILQAFFGPSTHLWRDEIQLYGHQDSYLKYVFAFLQCMLSTGAKAGDVLFTTAGGYMGLAPNGAQIGDKICVLFGCYCPLLIRPVEDHYLLVGSCYVYGMMQGEMIEEMRAGRLQEETISLW